MESYRAFYYGIDGSQRNHHGGSNISMSGNNNSTNGSGATLNHNTGGECSGNGGSNISTSGNNSSTNGSGATLNHNTVKSDEVRSGRKAKARQGQLWAAQESMG